MVSIRNSYWDNFLIGLCFLLYATCLAVKFVNVQVYLFPIVLLYVITIINKHAAIAPYRNFLPQKQLVYLLVGVLLTNLINATLSLDYLVKILIFVTLPFILVRRLGCQDYLRVTNFLVILGVFISCVVAVFQSMGNEIAVGLWVAKFYDADNGESQLQDIYTGRCAGLSSYSLNLGFQIVQVVPLALYGIITSKRFIVKLAYILFLGGLLLGAFATGGRAVVLLTLLLMVILLPAKHIKTAVPYLMFVALIGTVCIIYFSDTELFNTFTERLSGIKDESSRINTFQYYVSKWLYSDPIKWLFGFGFNTMNSNRSSQVLGSGHNFITTTIFEFGLCGIIVTYTLYKWFFTKANIFKGDKFLKHLKWSIIAYLIMSLTNDSSLISADFFHILILSFGLFYVAQLNIHYYDSNKR